MENTTLTDVEKIQRGRLLAAILCLHPDKQGRYPTDWGTKTALGLFETAKRIIEQGN